MVQFPRMVIRLHLIMGHTTSDCKGAHLMAAFAYGKREECSRVVIIFKHF